MNLVRVDARVVAALTQLPEVKRQVRAVANEIREDARAAAPVRTGRLRRSLKVENTFNPATRRVSYRVGWDKSVAYWGPMVELGTRRTRARPHLEPAAKRRR